MPRAAAYLVLILVTLLAAGGGILGPQGPDPLPADAPSDLFSADRAWRHLETLTAAHRAMGSPHHRASREYIVAELSELGLSPEIQATVVHRSRRPARAANVVNVAVRLPGREEGKAVLILGHYDSVPTGPGAGDNGSSVAAMLEALRALGSSGALRNDLIFLFVDGEEAGIFGARAFQEQHPWAQDVAVVLNFEARGTRGPTIMFETGPRSARLARELGRLPTPPVAPSYSFEVYRFMPNFTDFSVFKRAQRPGLNFAFIHGATGYHTAQDSLERLDRRSVQHHGETILGLARRLGDADLDELADAGDAVYFELAGLFVAYPASWARPIAVLLALATLAVLFLGRRRLAAGPVALAFLVQILIAAGLAVLFFFLGRLVFPSDGYNFALLGGVASDSLLLLGLSLVAVGATIAVHGILSRKRGSERLFSAGLLLWIVLLIFISFFAPGASYLFALPSALALPGAVLLWKRTSEEQRVSIGLVASLALLAAGTAYLWSATLAMVGVALAAGAVPLVGMMVAIFLLGMLAPLLSFGDASFGRRPLRAAAVATSLLLGISVILLVAQQRDFDESNRDFNTLAYEWNATSGEARWFTATAEVDPWLGQFMAESPRVVPASGYMHPWLRIRESPAPPLDGVAGAVVSVLREEPREDGRVLKLHVAWPQPTECAFLSLRPGSRLRSVTAGGADFDLEAAASEEQLALTWYAPPEEGLELRIEVMGTDPIEVEVVSQHFSLPELAGFDLERPAEFMPDYGWTTDSTFVRNVTVLELTPPPQDADPPAPIENLGGSPSTT